MDVSIRSIKKLITSCKAELWEQKCVQLFYRFKFKEFMTFKSQRIQAFCRMEKLTLIKTKRNQKQKTPQTLLDKQTL